jgi:hypothetical protein
MSQDGKIITFVKKVLDDGSDCPKCQQVTELLEKNGLMGSIDRTVIADAKDPSGEGMKLVKLWGMKRAPFFIVEQGGSHKAYQSALEFIKKELA